jgi:cyclophilin family peptidyl-prolyl cis-trans isomerase
VTHGRVLLRTTLGALEVELYARESPVACRNFVGLCLEGSDLHMGGLTSRIRFRFSSVVSGPT